VLTISQLAASAGVTVRAVRHYHHVGLLPEPERDASGYRRYSAQAVVDLIRIQTLADAGVPLARIDELLHAQPSEFATAIDDIDAELQHRIDQLTEHRRRIAELASGEGLFLPPEVVDILNRLRSLGSANGRYDSSATCGSSCGHWIRTPCRSGYRTRTPVSTTPRRCACISPAIRRSTGIHRTHAWIGSSTTWTHGISNKNGTATRKGT
jgi:DNA-binding transcriptional MerR regulator